MHPIEETIYHTFIIAGAVIGTIITYFILSILRQQKKHRALHNEMIAVEINTLESERTRMAADLHDELGPVLSAAKLKLMGIDDLCGPAGKAIDEAIVHIDSILERSREIAHGLMPNTLLIKGIVYALEEFTDHINASTHLRIIFSHTFIPGLLQDQSIHIYRIIQEIIHNAIKHAGATLLKIKLESSEDKLAIHIRDNGRGFNYASMLKSSKGLGLHNILRRIDILTGSIRYESAPGEGTAILIEIPLKIKKR